MAENDETPTAEQIRLRNMDEREYREWATAELARLRSELAEIRKPVDAGEFAGHTPGPWAYTPNDPVYRNAPYMVWTSDGPGYGTVAETNATGLMPTDPEKQSANARLIAAAPSLLAENARLRRELASVDESCAAVVVHKTLDECDGCGCLSLSPAERAAYMGRDYARLRAANAELARAARIETREVLAGSYVRRGPMLTHAVVIKGQIVEPLCRRVDAASIADRNSGNDIHAAPTCPECLRRDPRLLLATHAASAPKGE